MINWILFIVVGAIAGWAAGYALHRDTAFNVADVILGVVGALVGGWLSSLLLQVDLNTVSPLGLVMAFIGAVLVAFIYEKVTGKAAQ